MAFRALLFFSVLGNSREQRLGSRLAGGRVGLPACGDLPLAREQLAPVCLAVPADRARFLEVLPRISRSWPGSISAAVLTALPLAEEQRAFSRDALAAADACATYRIVLTLVAGAPFSVPTKIRFPHNLLRNVAVGACTDPYVLMLDADLEVFPPLSANILNSTARRLLTKNSRVAVVLPSFTVRADLLAYWDRRDVRRAPYAQKHLLRSLYGIKLASPFNSEFFSRGERATNYRKWLDRPTSKPYRVPYESGYEPYLLMRTDTAKQYRYDTRFVGYGFNKLSHIEELQAAGFVFKVCSELFLVHTHLHTQVNAEHDAAAEILRRKPAAAALLARNTSVIPMAAPPPTERCGGRGELLFKRNYLGASCIGQFYRKLYLLYGYKVRPRAAGFRCTPRGVLCCAQPLRAAACCGLSRAAADRRHARARLSRACASILAAAREGVPTHALPSVLPRAALPRRLHHAAAARTEGAAYLGAPRPRHGSLGAHGAPLRQAATATARLYSAGQLRHHRAPREGAPAGRARTGQRKRVRRRAHLSLA